ncbi:hypothetical protein HAV15_010625 [Penicillium sp. str. |nr:hypothetical protein HAV15_010625 [Penicillium sp. str. \
MMMAHISTVTKGPYIPWSPEEEEILPTWVSCNEHLPWVEIREEYVRQFKIPRSVHSLRGKLDQLQKGHRRKRPISKRAAELHHIAARQARHQQQRLWVVLPASPPPLNLKKTNPQVRRLLRQMKQLETARSYTSARSLLLEDDSQNFLSQVWDSSGEKMSPG